MSAALRVALHRLVDAVIAYDEDQHEPEEFRQPEVIPHTEVILRQNISLVLTLLDGQHDAG